MLDLRGLRVTTAPVVPPAARTAWGPTVVRLAGYLVAAGLVGCGAGPRADCTSSCGVRVLQASDSDRNPDTFCAEYQTAEDASLAALAAHVVGPAWPAAASCSALGGWAVARHDHPDSSDGWFEYYATGRVHVAGLTYCDYRMILVGTEDWARSSLTHEFAHAIERCADPHHENWAARGVWAAIADVAGGS